MTLYRHDAPRVRPVAGCLWSPIPLRSSASAALERSVEQAITQPSMH